MKLRLPIKMTKCASAHMCPFIARGLLTPMHHRVTSEVIIERNRMQTKLAGEAEQGMGLQDGIQFTSPSLNALIPRVTRGLAERP